LDRRLYLGMFHQYYFRENFGAYLINHTFSSFCAGFYVKYSVSIFLCQRHFSFRSQLEHRAPFGVSVITHTIRHTVGFIWTSDQPVAEASTYTEHNI
jgi:hypothetical protein